MIDLFVAPRLQGASPNALSQARIVAIACLTSATIHAGSSVVMAIQGLGFVAGANLLAALFSALLAWMSRRGASLPRLTNGLVGVLFLFVAGLAGSTGGDANSALHTVTIVPGVAILLGGWRTGTAWLLIACGFTAGLGLLRASGFEFPVHLDPAKAAMAKFPGVFALTLGISGVIFLSELVKQRALEDLAEAREGSQRAERARQEMETAMLEGQKLESLGVMAGGVAHDFNNLLTAILGNASLLAETPERERGGLAREIVLAAEQARDLTDQLLAFAGRSRSNRGAVALSDVVREVDSLAQAAKDPDVELRFELAVEPTTVVADRGQIRQVVLNLLTNASAASGGGGTVTVRTGSRGAEAFLEVEDEGVGMDETVRARIFDPFFTTRADGRGLGLSAVQGIVRAHGGHIEVESAPGQGTRVRVLLPRADLPVETRRPPARQAPPDRVRGSALVVDDIEAVRRLAHRTLSRMGFEVLEASDGREALELVDKHPELRVVLLDATMPGLRGDRVWAEIVDRRPDLPVILSTGDAVGFASVDPKTPGTIWLPKPYKAEGLQDAAARALSMASSR